MAWELRTGGVAGHVTSYVYIRDDGVYWNFPPHVAMISPGVRRNPLPLADHRFHLDLKIISKSQQGSVGIPGASQAARVTAISAARRSLRAPNPKVAQSPQIG